MDKTEIVSKLKEYSYLLRKHFALEKLILYGSYARGTQHLHSDIDVDVVVKDNKMDFFQYAPLLFKLSGMIDTKIEPVLIDENHDESGFLESIMTYGEIIYTA